MSADVGDATTGDIRNIGIGYDVDSANTRVCACACDANMLADI
jgi:hypothetical protein